MFAFPKLNDKDNILLEYFEIVAIFGMEVITDFAAFMQNHPNAVGGNVPQLFIGSDRLVKKLFASKPKHYKRFIKVDNACEELDLHDMNDQGGQDFKWAENVDIFFVWTHGSNDKTNAELFFNNKKNEWISNSKTWNLGDSNLLKWLVLIGCRQINLENPRGLGHVFSNLHEICGFYENMSADDTISEDLGNDLGHNLTKGDTVADAWLYGSTESDYNTAAIVVSAEHFDTWNKGNPFWHASTMNNDHLSGHGFTCSNIPKHDVGWLGVKWIEWYNPKRKRVTKTKEIRNPEYGKIELEIGELKILDEPVKPRKRRKRRKSK